MIPGALRGGLRFVFEAPLGPKSAGGGGGVSEAKQLAEAAAKRAVRAYDSLTEFVHQLGIPTPAGMGVGTRKGVLNLGDAPRTTPSLVAPEFTKWDHPPHPLTAVAKQASEKLGWPETLCQSLMRELTAPVKDANIRGWDAETANKVRAHADILFKDLERVATTRTPKGNPRKPAEVESKVKGLFSERPVFGMLLEAPEPRFAAAPSVAARSAAGEAPKLVTPQAAAGYIPRNTRRARDGGSGGIEG